MDYKTRQKHPIYFKRACEARRIAGRPVVSDVFKGGAYIATLVLVNWNDCNNKQNSVNPLFHVRVKWFCVYASFFEEALLFRLGVVLINYSRKAFINIYDVICGA